MRKKNKLLSTFFGFFLVVGFLAVNADAYSISSFDNYGIADQGLNLTDYIHSANQNFNHYPANTGGHETRLLSKSEIVGANHFGHSWNHETLRKRLHYRNEDNGDCTPVPEPATVLLLGFGLVGTGFFRIKKKK